MKAAELFDYLIGEGCQPGNFRVLDRGGNSDVLCLLRGKNRQWYVCYMERGRESAPDFSTSDEEEAVDYFKRRILSMEHRHCVGFFSKESGAFELQNRLETSGIEAVTDRIPYGGSTDPRYRVFVFGKEIFRARNLLGDNLPIQD